MSLLTSIQLLVFWFVETVGQTTFATIMSVKMTGHKNSSTTFIWGSLLVTDFAILIHLIVFQNSQLNLLSFMLVLLVSGIRLLPFLSATTKSQHKMKSGLLLNVVVRQSWRRQWQPTPVLLPGKSHGRRSLIGCSPWGREESRHDWATSLSLSLFTFLHWRRKWQPTPVFLPGESQGQGSLVGCCLWGRTESDTTEVT